MSTMQKPDGSAAAVSESFPAQRRQHSIDLLLRQPDALLERLEEHEGSGLRTQLALLALGGYLVYGLVVGSFSGGAQWWAAPFKILLGTTLCGAICFPSLYIFITLSGAEARPVQVLGVLLGVLSLTGILLAGFAPVAWVFSQSSTLVSFIGGLHLLVWFVSMLATQRVLSAGLKRWGGKRSPPASCSSPARTRRRPTTSAFSTSTPPATTPTAP